MGTVATMGAPSGASARQARRKARKAARAAARRATRPPCPGCGGPGPGERHAKTSYCHACAARDNMVKAHEAVTPEQRREWGRLGGATRMASMTQAQLREWQAKGAAAVTTHGLTRHPLYYTWKSMVYRCTNTNSPDWEAYGGRGITVCDRWLHSVEAFIADVGERPEGHTLDRIDNDGNYEPGNCRWADAKTQNANRRPRSRAVAA